MFFHYSKNLQKIKQPFIKENNFNLPKQDEKRYNNTVSRETNKNRNKKVQKNKTKKQIDTKVDKSKR